MNRRRELVRRALRSRVLHEAGYLLAAGLMLALPTLFVWPSPGVTR